MPKGTIKNLPIFTQELYDSYCVLLSESYCALLSDSYCVLLSDSYWVLDLNKLIASAHEQIKPFKCNICDASFTKLGQIPIWRIAVFWRKEAIQITNDVCTVDTSFSKHKNVHTGENAIPIWIIVVIVKEGSLITYWQTFCYF